jgi:hypothetical protein
MIKVGCTINEPHAGQEMRENTSDTRMLQADKLGVRLPIRAVPKPIAGPHHSASLGMRNAGKKAMGNLNPPR